MRGRLVIPLGLLALALGLFSDVLLSGGASVPARPGTDLSIQFLAWRDFAGRELGAGRLPLWNPHIYSGASFVGGFQSALFYPLTWLHAALPLGQAVNLSATFHVFLAGLFAAWWASRLGASRAGAFLSGVSYMFCGPFFLHLSAGHLSQVGVMAWTPLLFLSLDGWLDSLRPGWLLLGSAALALQVLAGNPQYAYYALSVSALYAGLRLWTGRRGLGTAALGLGAMATLGILLSAVQLLPGIETALDSVRSGGVPLAFASQVSLPPENLLTLLAPEVLGDMRRFPYFCRWYLWEASLFVGIGTLLLSLTALAPENGKRPRILAGLALLCLVVALGPLTPLYAFLYHAAPMFASFRGAAKCAFLSALFLSVLAGVGSETLWRRPDRPTPFLMAAGTLGLRPRPRPGRGKSFLPVLAMLAASAAGGAGLWLLAHGNAAQDAWASLLGRLASTGVADVAAGTLRDPGFLEASARFAAVSLLAAAAKLALFGGLLSPAARACAGTGAGWAFIVLAVGEMLVFAAGSRASMSSRLDRPPAWKPSLLDRAGDARVLHEGPLHANSGMVWGSSNLWGHDPLLRKRYAEFMAVSQGLQPDQGGQYLRFTRTSPVLAILRLKRVLQEDPGRPVVTVPGAFPRVMLVRDWAVVNGRDAVLRALFLPGVDLAKLVILETPPFPGAGVQRPSQGPPAPGPPISWKTGGSARVVAETTDELDIEAQTPDPALLLVTDAYAPGWRASPLEGSDQREYRVLPADHVLRAVPLSPGRHRLRLEYSPTSFRVGAIVSALALAGFLGWTARLLMRRTNKESSGSLSFPS